MTTSNTVTLHNYKLNSLKTWYIVVVLVAGNLILPQLAHLIPGGGPALLPIYFFTLIAAYKFGIRAGMLTAILSPLINSMLFGMPVVAMLPVVLVKSAFLAIAASQVASRFQQLNILLLVLVVTLYQIAGSLVEWLISGSLNAAMQDITLGLPGIALQIAGGYLVIRLLRR